MQLRNGPMFVLTSVFQIYEISGYVSGPLSIAICQFITFMKIASERSVVVPVLLYETHPIYTGRCLQVNQTPCVLRRHDDSCTTADAGKQSCSVR